MDNKEIHKEKVFAGQRSYFLEIKQTLQGDYYLKISESKKNDKGEYEHHRVMIFDEDIDRFDDAFRRTLAKLKELYQTKNEKLKTNSKAYSVNNIRQTHKEAYKPWTQEDDNKLETLLCEGKSANELAKIFGRKDGAITSRIKKL